MNDTGNKDLIKYLSKKAQWVMKETLRIHKIAPETRLASSLSCLEIFVSLYYGNILRFNSENLLWNNRDRFIISKGHGAVSLYPILADLGYFSIDELSKVCTKESFLGGIPDIIIPGIETTNGSLGHGLGVASGIAIALKRRKNDAVVFVLSGDGELYEGSVWEAIMFSAEHKLDNLVLIIDNNKICMLDYCANIIDISPVENKFSAFNWEVRTIDGHNIEELCNTLLYLKNNRNGHPKLLVANTTKGKGIKQLEGDRLCHIKSLNENEINEILERLE
ncbi:MAG: transketolase [Nitrospirae bacterium]|nr:transketolase [Nitrospirota bacterium]